MADNVDTQHVEIIHTVPVITDIERRAAKKRIANDLFNVLSDIYNKLKSDSE